MNEAATVELLMDFVNTRSDGGGRKEQWGDGAAFDGWLDAHSLASREAPATDADAASARELRDSLVSMLLVHSGDPVSSADLELAEQHLVLASQTYPLTARISAQGATLRTYQRGSAGALGAVLAAVTLCALRGEWSRIRACRNPPCHFGFVDTTRNATRQYCSAACSSQVGMRAYRARQRAAKM